VSEQSRIGTVPADWRTLAACRGLDPELFFPARGDSFAARNAQAVCATCPVAEQCLEFAIEVGETEGIWGGLSGRQLRAEKRRRAGGRKGPKPSTTLKPIKHGTDAGYNAHRYRGEQPCQWCREAHAAYNAERERKQGTAA
jgi:WhiB family redox-sensing transcriptional regulator